MTTPREREQFKADFEYDGCFKCWQDERGMAPNVHHCHRRQGHDGDCVCGCGARFTKRQWAQLGIPNGMADNSAKS